MKLVLAKFLHSRFTTLLFFSPTFWRKVTESNPTQEGWCVRTFWRETVYIHYLEGGISELYHKENLSLLPNLTIQKLLLLVLK